MSGPDIPDDPARTAGPDELWSDRFDDGDYEDDGECFRGDEAAASVAEQQAWIQRNLK